MFLPEGAHRFLYVFLRVIWGHAFSIADQTLRVVLVNGDLICHWRDSSPAWLLLTGRRICFGPPDLIHPR